MIGAGAQNQKKWIDIGIAAGVTLLAIIILAARFDFYYDLNDDLAMKDILSGTYTGIPDGHNIQMLYPLGWFLSRMYRFLPMLPWYGIFLCGCQFLALFFCLNALLSKIRKGRGKIIAALPAAAAGIGLFFYEWIFVQYTVTAGLLTIAAVFRIASAPELKGREFCRYHGATIFMTIVSFMLRSEMMLLLCPFLGLAVLYRILDGISQKDKPGKGSLLQYAGLLGIIGALMAGALFTDYMGYRSPQWKEFRQLFDDRTLIYDFYGIPAYGDNHAFYDSIEMSEASYELLENYNFDLDARIDAPAMKAIAEYAASHQQVGMAGRLYLSLYTYIYRFIHGQELFFDLLGLFAYFFLLRAAFAGKDRILLCKTGLLFFTRLGIWLFLLYRGRVPERITHPLYLAELVLLFVMLFQDVKVFQWKKNEKWAILILYSVFFLCIFVVNGDMTAKTYTQREHKNIQWQTWKNYAAENPEQFYYLDVYSTVAYSEKMFSDAGADYRNFDLAGGWCVKSPLAYAKRIRGGMTDKEAQEGAKALLSEGNFFVADHTSQERYPQFLNALYMDKMNIQIDLKEIDTVDNFTVYQITEAAK